MVVPPPRTLTTLQLWDPRGSRLSSQLLLRFHARRDRRNNARRHLELVIAVVDSVSPCDPVEIGIGGPDLALIVFEDEQPHRPVEPSISVCRDELRAEQRITKDQEHRGAELDSSIGR